MARHWEARCSKCQASYAPDLVQRLWWLRAIGKLRQEARPDVTLVDELFRTAGSQFSCPGCGAIGLSIQLIEDDDEDAAWGMPRRCDDCGTAIPRERLELFPQSRLCVACQSRDERGEISQSVDYCPHCGSAMTLAPSRTTGITRYRLTCRACGRR